jgi:hypothetical protein
MTSIRPRCSAVPSWSDDSFSRQMEASSSQPGHTPRPTSRRLPFLLVVATVLSLVACTGSDNREEASAPKRRIVVRVLSEVRAEVRVQDDTCRGPQADAFADEWVGSSFVVEDGEQRVLARGTFSGPPRAIATPGATGCALSGAVSVVDADVYAVATKNVGVRLDRASVKAAGWVITMRLDKDDL